MSSPRPLLVGALLAAGTIAAGCASSRSAGVPATPPSAGSPSRTPLPATSASTPPAATKIEARVATWSLPAARSREVALSTPSGVVIAGGLSSAHVSTSTIWTLSPATGHVLHTQSLPVGVHDAAGAVVGRTPYVLAGGNTTTVDDVQAVPAAGPARVVGHLPQPRSDLSATSTPAHGYVLGGFDGTNALSAVLRTSDGRHFSAVARLLVTVRYAAVADIVGATGDQLLVFGGEHNGIPIDDVQDVDLTTGHTRVVGHLPQPLAHEAAFSLGGAVWLAGGRSSGQLQSRVWRWNTSAHRAVPAGRLPYAVADTSVAVVGSTAYVVGGETPEPTARIILLTVR